MLLTYDPKKREATLAERGLDFADASLIFAGPTLEIEDPRKANDREQARIAPLLGI